MNILLVDDQEKILEATKKLVNWEKLHVDEVFTASGAAAAKRILSGHQVDIMLTDIEMPGEDGIALQRWQADMYPAVACIFLTSHADFAYAKEAIRNGAFDYILQPAGMAEIEETVERCIRFLEEQKRLKTKSREYDERLSEALETHVLAMFYQKGQFSHMDKWRMDSCTEEEEWWYLPCLVEVWQADSTAVKKALYQAIKDVRIGEDISGIAGRLDDGQVGILFYSKGKIPEAPLLKEKLYFILQQITEEFSCELNMYLGQCARDDLPEQIEQIFAFQSGRVLKKDEVYLVEAPEPVKLRRPDGAVWGRWLIRRDTALVRNQITNLLRYAQQEQHLTLSYMHQLLHAFLEACSVACYEQKVNLSELFTNDFSYEQMLRAYSSVQELCRGVDFCLRRYETLLPKKEGEEGCYSVQERIQEILYYLDENMDRMISRREAAKAVFLSEDYFSRMFLKETGMRYKEYVMKHKMDYAGKLLADTDLPVTLAASKVGYDNFTNFTKTFRRFMGMTPTEYRKKHQRNVKSER